MTLRPGGRFTGAILAFDRAETRLRTASLKWIRGIPGFLHYKMVKKLRLLQEITELFAAERVSYRVSGGFAYDAKRGRLTRYHNDIDFVFLDNEVDPAISALSANGFDVSVNTPYAAVARKYDQHADLFTCRRVEGGLVETVSLEQHGPPDGRCSIIRLPEVFLSWDETVEFKGIRYPIVCNEYLASILPFVDDPVDRKFIAALPIRLPMKFARGQGVVQLTLSRLEFQPQQSEPGTGRHG